MDRELEIPLEYSRISIIGVGLIGGSFARALRANRRDKRWTITGYDTDEASLKKAVELGVLNDYSLDIDAVVKSAHIVVIATPLSATEKILPKIVQSLRADAIVTDVGSVKGSVVAVAKAVMGDKIKNFVPAHPIAGTEQSGFVASFAELFEGHKVVLTPIAETDKQACQLIAQLWRRVGANVIELDVAEHDRIFAATSHLPHLLAYALVDDLVELQARGDLFQYAAGGFADFTRIASSNAVMWRDICLSNRVALLDSLALFSDHLDKIKDAIEQQDGEKLLAIFQGAKEARDRFAKTRNKLKNEIE